MENIIYYSFLFLLVIIIRFFKLKNDLGANFNRKWNEIFNASLEIVYTASGIVIALILNVDKVWIAPVVIIYLVLVIFTALLEMSSNNFSSSVKTFLHLLIILLIIISTIVSYKYIIPKVDIHGMPKELNINKKYKIIVPYIDHSILKHIGYTKLKNKSFYFEHVITTSNVDSAKIIFMNKTINDIIIKPTLSNNIEDIQITYDKITIIELE